MQNIKTQNWIASGVHLFTALLLISFYNYWPASHSLSYFQVNREQIAGPDTPGECTSNGSTAIQPGQCSTNVAYQAPKNVIAINLIYGCIAFFLFTSLAHAFYASDAFGSGNYTRYIREGWNPYRWFEYGTTATIMSVLIGLTVGCRDITTVLALAFMTMAMQFNGYTVESVLRAPLTKYSKETIQGSTVAGWTLFLGLWTIVLYQFYNTVQDVNTLYSEVLDADSKPIRVPSWIWFIIVAQLVQYALFGIIQSRQITSTFKALGAGTTTNYLTTEASYIKLSYVAKLSLAGGIGYGLLFRTRDCPVD